MSTILQVKDKTATTACVCTEGGNHEAKYKLVDGVWSHDNDVAGDLENHLIAALGSEQAAWAAIDAALGQ